MPKDKNIILIIIFTSIIAVINLIWTHLNQAPPQWDQSLYLDSANTLFLILKNRGIIDFYYAIQKTMDGIRAPLISLAVLPFYFLFGNNDKTAILLNIVLLFVFSIYLYKLVCVLFDKKTALYSVIISQTMPLLVNINRQFLTEYLLVTFVVIFLYYLAKSDNLNNSRNNTKMGIALGFGLLSKISFPLIIIGPFLITLINRIKNKKKYIKLLLNLLEIAAPAIIIASIWYIPNINNVFSFGIDVAWGKTAKDFGDSDIFNLPLLLNLYKKIIINCSIYYFFLYIYLCYQNKKNVYSYKQKKSIIFLIAWFILPLTAVTLAVTKDIRYTIPFIPSFSIILALQFKKYQYKNKNQATKRIRTIVLLLVIPTMIIIFSSFSGKISYCNQKETSKDITCQNYSGKPDKNNWHAKEIVTYINQKMPRRDGDIPNFCFIAIEHRATNLPLYRYYNNIVSPISSVDFTSVWSCKSSYDDFIKEIEISKPKCIIFPIIEDKQDIISCYRDEKYQKIHQFIKDSHPDYFLDKTYPVDQNNKIEIYWINK